MAVEQTLQHLRLSHCDPTAPHCFTTVMISMTCGSAQPSPTIRTVTHCGTVIQCRNPKLHNASHHSHGSTSESNSNRIQQQQCVGAQHYNLVLFRPPWSCVVPSRTVPRPRHIPKQLKNTAPILLTPCQWRWCGCFTPDVPHANLVSLVRGTVTLL